MGCGGSKPKKFGDETNRKTKVGEIKRRSQYAQGEKEVERRRSTAPKMTKISKEEPVVSKISERQENDAPKQVAQDRPVNQENAAPAAEHQEREEPAVEA